VSVVARTPSISRSAPPRCKSNLLWGNQALLFGSSVEDYWFARSKALNNDLVTGVGVDVAVRRADVIYRDNVSYGDVQNNDFIGIGWGATWEEFVCEGFEVI
jgi:hypothetical protein